MAEPRREHTWGRFWIAETPLYHCDRHYPAGTHFGEFAAKAMGFVRDTGPIPTPAGFNCDACGLTIENTPEQVQADHGECPGE